MAEPIFEGDLRFEFHAEWLALKFDDTSWYRSTARDGVKAVDVVACNPAGTIHWWLEIKDCMGFESDNLPRLSPTPPEAVGQTKSWLLAQGYGREVQAKRAKPFVVDEVAEKLEGTLVSLIAAGRASPGQQDALEVHSFAKVMEAAAQWSVVLLLTWNPTARDFGRLAMRLRDKLQQRLAAYNVQCFVLNQSESAPHQPWAVTRVAP